MKKEIHFMYFCARGHEVKTRSDQTHRGWCKECDDFVVVKTTKWEEPDENKTEEVENAET
jgi:hypothetical protein